MHNFQGYVPRTFQDLKLQFPGLSRIKVIFQDFPGPGNLKKKIQDFPGFSRRCGNPDMHTHTHNIKCRKYRGMSNHSVTITAVLPVPVPRAGQIRTNE